MQCAHLQDSVHFLHTFSVCFALFILLAANATIKHETVLHTRLNLHFSSIKLCNFYLIDMEYGDVTMTEEISISKKNITCLPSVAWCKHSVCYWQKCCLKMLNFSVFEKRQFNAQQLDFIFMRVNWKGRRKKGKKELICIFVLDILLRRHALTWELEVKM